MKTLHRFQILVRPGWIFYPQEIYGWMYRCINLINYRRTLYCTYLTFTQFNESGGFSDIGVRKCR